MTEHLKMARGIPRVRYVADGHQTVFAYSFPIFASEDLEVFLNAALQLTGFTVSGSGASIGGSVTFTTAPGPGVAVTLSRRVPIERVTDFQESGPLSALALNTELDTLTACLQQVAADQANMLHYADTDLPASAELPGRALRANRLLSFDSNGNPGVTAPVDAQALSTYTPSGTGAAARPISDKLGDLVSVKDFGAVGDGVTDDTLAIQAALTAHQAVFIPAGSYRISGTLTVKFGQTLFGTGQSSILVGAGNGFDLILLPDSYATVRGLRLENGRAGIKLCGLTGPCVQNTLEDLTLWQPSYGVVLDGGARTDWPCYWNNIVRVLVAKPATHGVWLTVSGVGDTPNANKFLSVRVYSLGETLSGSGFYVEAGRYNNAFVDCEANVHPNALACFRLGARTDKNLLVNLYCESLGAVPNVQIDAGSIETSIINLFSAAAGPAIYDLSGGHYTAVNAGYPTKNRLMPTRITELTVEALRYDTTFYDAPAAGTVAIDLSHSVWLVSAFNGAVEARLPAAGDANGFAVTIKKTDGSAWPVTVTEASGGVGPDGHAVVLGNRYDFITVVSNGANWWITGANRLPGNANYHEGAGLFQPDLSQDLYMVSAWSGAVEVRLPDPAATNAVGRTVSVKKSDTSGNSVSVTATRVTGPDGESIPLTEKGHSVTAMSNGSAWQILARNP
ncbi:MAG: glycosyl hydrolase family 28-related protein [Rhodospirillaceae bacterium]